MCLGSNLFLERYSTAKSRDEARPLRKAPRWGRCCTFARAFRIVGVHRHQPLARNLDKGRSCELDVHSVDLLKMRTQACR